jgi:hypothetical protein
MAFNKVAIKSNSQKAIRSEIARVEQLIRTEPTVKPFARLSYIHRLYKALEPLTLDFGIEEKEIDARAAKILAAGGIVVDERNGRFFVIVDSVTGAIVD